MEQITFELTIQEANRILEALGQLPYVQVHQLIHKLQSQAEAQLNEPQSSSVTHKITAS